jgi:hypothetical protein
MVVDTKAQSQLLVLRGEIPSTEILNGVGYICIPHKGIGFHLNFYNEV